MPTKYFPSLSNITKIEQLPEQLNFIQGGINAIFNQLGYRNLRVSRSLSGDSVSFDLDIMILNRELKLDIPGTGFALSLNPGGDTGTTAIPISLTTHWGIKRYLKNFNLQTFSYTPEHFLELAFQIFILNDKSLIATTALNFETAATPLDDLANALITNRNLSNLTLPLSTDFKTAIDEIYTASQSTSGFKFSDVINFYYGPITTNHDSILPEHYTKRFTHFGKGNGLINGNNIWIADDNSSIGISIRNDLKDRIRKFMVFFYIAANFKNDEAVAKNLVKRLFSNYNVFNITGLFGTSINDIDEIHLNHVLNRFLTFVELGYWRIRAN